MTEIYEKIKYILILGPVSPPNLVGVLTNVGFNRKDVQIELQIGLERGYWHLDQDMHIKLGSFWELNTFTKEPK